MAHEGSSLEEHRRARRDERSARREARRDERAAEREARAERKRERKHGRRRHRHARREAAPSEAPGEERRYREARSRANKRMSLLFHEVAYGGTLLLIFIATRSLRVTLIVAAAWGIGLVFHHLIVFGMSNLRQRWIEEELGREVKPAVSEERRIVEERKVRSLEDLSASIAHEIRNPITAAKSLVQQMGEDPTATDNIDYAHVALGELDRVERSISHLLRYARDEALRIETLELADVIESALATFRDRIARAGVDVDLDLAGAGIVRGDGEKLRRVVINLLANSLDALDAVDGPSVAQPRLQISAGGNLAGTDAWLRVRDNGPGMDRDTQVKIFDPFYTTKESGTGLGLALSKRVIEAHGGTIDVLAEPGSGTEFVVSFPRDPEAGGRTR